METSIPENHKNVATAIHLSTFAKYLFPFGNFLAPLILWTTNKEKDFVQEHGREAINFQLSMLLYALAIGILCLPFFTIFASDFVGLVEIIDHHVHEVSVKNVDNLSGLLTLFLVAAILLLGLFVLELYAVISATIHANRGEYYKYPLSIPFIKTTPQPIEESSSNQSKNEHVN
ncbi:MAG: DUF4870 domain-containing protein [Bacteroidetes bacterium]|nr:DUF4870 domain-containing protein [Bacteroidota bacterium]